jgi:hypothetical protein
MGDIACFLVTLDAYGMNWVRGSQQPSLIHGAGTPAIQQLIDVRLQINPKAC